MVREVINSGERSFDEFVELLEKSSRFKKWIGIFPDDTSILKEYIESISSVSWLSSTPGKSLRFSTFNGAGIALDALAGGMPVASIPLGAFDTFLVDKLGIGWKPRHFIERRLKPFVYQ